jgi:NAD+ kinase
MAEPSKPVLKRMTVVHNESTDPQNIYRERVRRFLEDRGVEVHVTPVATKDCPVVVAPEDENPDMVLVLGGDGTFLRAARCYAQRQVPLVGVNTGTLGFLTRIEADRVERYLKLLMEGQFGLEERMMLAVNDPNQLVLNDVVIKNANPSVMARLRLFIDDDLVASYDADGIILATPTGSTAYTLSAGGPVISPEVEAISITPICPHSLSAKPIIIPANKVLRVASELRNGDIICAVDGQENDVMKPGERITVFRAGITLKIVNFRMDEDNFYRLLNRKLHWAMNPRHKTAVI